MAGQDFDVKQACSLIELEPTQRSELRRWVDDSTIVDAVANFRGFLSEFFLNYS